MSNQTVAGTESGQRRLNGVQTSGRSYRALSEPRFATIVDANQAVPVRDGCSLLADVVRPDAEGRFPALIAASPYPRQIQNSGIPMGFVEAGASDFFVPRGYVHVLANVRGTGGSGGSYDLLGPADRRDMYDLVEWAAAQPWCDGNVGMIGISAFAMMQFAAAVEQPPHLRAIFPVAATADVYEIVYHGGLMSETFIRAWLKSLGTLNGVSDSILRSRVMRAVESALKLDLIHKRLEHFNGEAALKTLSRVLPPRYDPHPWDDVLVSVLADHQTKDSFWRERDLLALLDQVRVPVYLGCDWENVPLHLPSTFSAFAALPRDLPVRVALMQPGGLSWPWESLHVEALAWFDQWLKGRETGILDGPAIRYCMPGAADGWRQTDRWPPSDVRPVSLTLSAEGALSSGQTPEGSRDYLHLPSVSLPAGHEDAVLRRSLTWESRPLPAPVEIAGAAEVVLEAAITAIDTSWIVTLQDASPDDRPVDVTAGWLRAALRRDGEPAGPRQAIPPGERLSYHIDLVHNARCFQTGHRIRLVLTSDDRRGPAMMGFEHTPIGLPSRNTVFSASRLILPVVSGLDALTSATQPPAAPAG
jgi:predicted acyl esterase